MKINRFAVLAYVAWVPQLLYAQDADERPILKESPARLVEIIESVTKDFARADYVILTRDVSLKRVRIFSSVPSVKAGEFVEDGYTIEVIYNRLMTDPNLGPLSYRFQHNAHVLTFAAAQFASGKKALAKRLVQMLSQAEPGLGWSSPTHPRMPLQEILRGLEKEDKTIGEFLRDQSEEWQMDFSAYGPPGHDPKAPSAKGNPGKAEK